MQSVHHADEKKALPSNRQCISNTWRYIEIYNVLLVVVSCLVFISLIGLHGYITYYGLSDGQRGFGCSRAIKCSFR